MSADGEVFLFPNEFALRELIFVFGEVGVALVGLIDVGDDEIAHERHQEFIHLRASDDEDLLIDEWMVFDVARVMDGLDAMMVPRRVGGEDNVFSFGKRSTNGFKGFTSHQDGVPRGVFFEKLEVIREVPRESSLFSDDSLRGHCYDSSEVHTATAALMCG